MHPFVGAGQRSARKPSFLGEGRWLAEGQTDEGAMREAFPSPLRRREGFALRGEVLSQRGKVPKGSPGTAQDGHFVSIFAFPRTPFTGVTP